MGIERSVACCKHNIVGIVAVAAIVGEFPSLFAFVYKPDDVGIKMLGDIGVEEFAVHLLHDIGRCCKVWEKECFVGDILERR